MSKDSIWSYECKPTDSWAWRKLLANHPSIQNLIQFHVGDSGNTFLWKDPWVHVNFLPDIIGPNFVLALGMKKNVKVCAVVDGLFFKN